MSDLNERIAAFLACPSGPSQHADLMQALELLTEVRDRPATDRDAVLEEAARACDDRVFAWRPCESSKAAACCAEAIRALKATPAPITPSAVDEAERRGAERATAQVVAWLRREADKFAKRAADMTMASWRRRAFTSGACEYLDVATYIERGDHTKGEG